MPTIGPLIARQLRPGPRPAAPRRKFSPGLLYHPPRFFLVSADIFLTIAARIGDISPTLNPFSLSKRWQWKVAVKRLCFGVFL